MSMTDDSREAMTHTAEPWWIHRLNNGWPVITSATHDIADLRMNGKGISHVEANARRICAAVNACQGISTEALERGAVSKLLAALIDLIEQLEVIGIPYWHGAQGLCLEQARTVIAEAAAHLPADQRKPIVIEARGGVVQGVLNVPPSYHYEIKDYDSPEAGEEDACRQQSPLDKWLEKCDTPQESEPTNRDRARWAGDAIAIFTDATFSGDHPGTMHRGDLECAIADLIADLLHLAHLKGFDRQEILEQGSAHFKTELLLDG